MDSSGSSGALEEDRQQAMSQRIRELENELAALKASAADSERPSTSFGATGGAVPRHTDSVVYVQQDRKMPPFSGRLDAVDALSLDEWIEQMRDFSQTRGRTEKERAQIVYDHLEGAARTEINAGFTTVNNWMEWKRTLRYCQMMDAITNSPDPYPIRVQDFQKPFVLEVDASHGGLGAVLSQEHGGLQYRKVDRQGK
ncbi:hypothetical protein OJAV_G00198260 [Oryzias javanicus]|uniref:Reverse transcriptase/retrotransposon-derived protein RNase H-like domain-containing protein n=1 Tax=Oryzias javanicus TaxID=123683 RepID=A0A3S2NTD3_ORYJA|nr:hypothetical protein OJAV_G00198260 [Oryzias javanicus]